MPHTWPPRNFDAIDAQAGNILDTRTGVTTSSVGTVDASPVQLDISDRQGEFVAVNTSLQNVDVVQADETYELIVESSDDDFSTIKREARYLVEAADVDREDTHTLPFFFDAAEVRSRIVVGGSSPSTDIVTWISPLESV